MANPYLDFFEKELPQHVSRAMGNRLQSRKQKKPQLAKPDQEESPAHEAAESPEAEAQEDEGIPGASQGDEGHDPTQTNTSGDRFPARKVYMMPSEKLERKAMQKHQPPRSPLKPRVVR